MSERKLNRRQRWRAEKIQAERQIRSQKTQRDLESQLQSGNLSSEQTGLVCSRFSKEFEIEALEGADAGSIHRCVARTNLGPIVAGDRVIWRAAPGLTGVIVSRQPRSCVLERPDNFGRLKPMAANIDQMLIVFASKPAPQPNLIDRYLVAAELLGVRPVLVLNKADLLNDESRRIISPLIDQYEGLAYTCVSVISSRHQAADLAHLPTLIQGRISIVVGQSGVGKSSLINTLLPELNLEVGALSQHSGEGTHTTVRATLFHVPSGGQLIDSPGIRDFSLWHIDLNALQRGFIEINDAAARCKFRDCRHEGEPACAVAQAVADGTISARRFASFNMTKQAILGQQARGLTL
jgi:ribosome biogenesis GTPase